MKINITPLLDTLRLEKISDETYFSEKYKNYISNSRLGLINPSKEGSPEKFFDGFKNGFNSSFLLGSAIHQLILQPDLFYLADDVAKPTAKVGAIADELYLIGKVRTPSDNEIIAAATKIDYYGGCLTRNKIDNILDRSFPYWDARKHFESQFNDSEDRDKELIYLDSKSRETVLNCVNALKSNKNIQKLLQPEGLINEVISECEQAILLDIEVEIPELDSRFVLRLKSKLDNYTIDTDTDTITVNDVKSIGKLVSEAETNIQNYSYNREIAMYSWLLSLCARKFYNIEKPIIKGNYLFVSTVPKYYTKVIPMTKQMYSEGWREFQYLLKLVCYHVATKYKDFAYKWM